MEEEVTAAKPGCSLLLSSLMLLLPLPKRKVSKGWGVRPKVLQQENMG